MAIEEEMASIEATMDESLSEARRRDAERDAPSRPKLYRKALAEVQRIAGNAAMRDLAAWIREQLRDEGEPPSGRDVRQKGAEICRDRGEEVSTGSWLGA